MMVANETEGYSMKKFHKIKAFHHVVKESQHAIDDPECPEQYKLRRPVHYLGTVKIHGTNAGVEFLPDSIVPWSRSRALSVTDDNMGFALFVAGEAQQTALRDMERTIRDLHQILPAEPLTVFGEWCGPGIQRGCGVQRLAAKQFVVFAARTCAGFIPPMTLCYPSYRAAGIYFIDRGPSWSITVDFTDRASIEAAANTMTKLTDEVEERCPWAARFGVDGIGEGIVWRPTGDHSGRDDIWFKTKGEKHRRAGARVKMPSVLADPEIAATVDAFVDMFVTTERLERGIDAMREKGHPIDMRSTGHYLKWIGQDVQSECVTELVASGLSWKIVAKRVSAKAVAFWKVFSQTIGT
jgi:hypothetical protein